MRFKAALLSAVVVLAFASTHSAYAATLGFADVVIDYFDSGVGSMPGPYGGTDPGSFPVAVSLDVVLGDDPGSPIDFLSLPQGSYVTVGFLDESVIDGAGDDIFIREVGPNGEKANVFVSTDGVSFTFLGVAQDNVTTAFDLASIGFMDPVGAIRIEGLDNFGGSPGFDVVNVQVLQGSIGDPTPIIPEPATAAITLALLGVVSGARPATRGPRS
jgi:hypothetical protein